MRWDLPRGPAGGGFATVSDAGWTVLDLDGDRRPDLVWMGLRRTAADGSTHLEPWLAGGRGHWRFYRNTGSGFALDATSWPLPAELDPARAWMLPFGGAQTPLFDMDGDELPDLVLVVPPDQSAQPSPQPWRDAQGHAVWRIYRNTGAGFADTAMEHQLPSSAPAVFAPGDGWWMLDLDGDGRQDLVRSAGYDARGLLGPFDVPGGGNPHFRVHRGVTGGFAEDAHLWSLPLAALAAPTMPLTDPSWGLLDLDGDRRPELIHTGVAAGGGGADAWSSYEVLRDGPSEFWAVYPNTGASFAEPYRHRVPPSADPRGFALMSNEQQPWLPGATSAASWTVADVDGDRRMELVDYGFWASGTALAPWGRPGELYWKVHRLDAQGDGFVRLAERWQVPSDVTLEAAPGGIVPSTWHVMDLDGDGAMDLVRTAQWVATGDGARLEVHQDEGRAHWRVHFGSKK